MRRDDKWKQPNPRMQMVAVLSAVRGAHLNYKEGICTAEKLAEVLDRHLDELAQLAKGVGPGKWTNK